MNRRCFFQASALAACIALLHTGAALAQMASCSSDGQATALSLHERFISADCTACWATAPASPPPRSSVISLDWIVPSAQGDEAPLSSAALQDSLLRLAQHPLARPTGQAATQQSMPMAAGHNIEVRVAHGVAFNGYIGTSIELHAPTATWQHLARQGADISAHLALVERIPAGTDGTPIARLLVRNFVSPRWNIAQQLQKQEQRSAADSAPDAWAQRSFHAFQPMSFPDGASSTRLSVIGWVDTASQQLLGLAQTVCQP